MAERPIIFSASMVRAILDGRKTVTRRVVALPEFCGSDTPGYAFTFRDRRMLWQEYRAIDFYNSRWSRYGQPGDGLWVKEGWQHARQQYCQCPQASEAQPCDAWSEGLGCVQQRGAVVYRADGEDGAPRWRSPIYMPRWASRIDLRVVSVRVERLHEITDEDARREGVRELRQQGCASSGWWTAVPEGGRLYRARDPVAAFRNIWINMHAPSVWTHNPWVWRVEFSRVEVAR